MPHTLYVAPGKTKCNIYLINAEVLPGQKPVDLMDENPQCWAKVGELDGRLQLKRIDSCVSHLRVHLNGCHPGTYFRLGDDLQLLD